jgi:hypothetical protein
MLRLAQARRQRLLAENPGWSRRRLSAELCRAWNGVQPHGALRDMGCRSLLLQLHRSGRIELPAQRMSPPNNVVARSTPAPSLPLGEQPRPCSLHELGPREIRPVRRTAYEALSSASGWRRTITCMTPSPSGST